ncbi:MAG: GxxExxY protein [Candidatus Paceibacterota bacterium]
MNENKVIQIKDNDKMIVFPELSFKIIGATFNVFNKLNWGMQEKYYQRALAKEFSDLGLRYEKEKFIPLEYKNEKIGHYFADFIIEGKILLELKVVSKLGYIHCKQVLEYLKNANIKLGILIYFTKDGVKYRRVLNSKINNN